MRFTSPGRILCGNCFPSVTRLINAVKIGLPSVSGCQPSALLTSLCRAGANICHLHSFSEKELKKQLVTHTQEWGLDWTAEATVP